MVLRANSEPDEMEMKPPSPAKLESSDHDADEAIASGRIGDTSENDRSNKDFERNLIPEEVAICLDGENQDNDPPKFAIGQKVLAKDERSGLLYDAIVRRHQYAPRSFQSIHTELLQQYYCSDMGADRVEIDLDKDAARLDGQLHCWHYFLHYLKWNVRWDAWVEENVVLEDTIDNRNLMKMKSRKIAKKGDQRSNSSDQHATPTSRKEDISLKVVAEKSHHGLVTTSTKRNEQRLKCSLSCPRKSIRYADSLPLPFVLKKILVEEWEIITCSKISSAHQGNIRNCRMLPIIPARVSIEHVLENYLKEKSELPVWTSDDSDRDSHTGDRECWIEMVNGIRILFNQSLPSRLLYPQEWPQMRKVSISDSAPLPRWSQIYGCEQLLRLIAKLPTLLLEFQMDRKDVFDILSKVGNLVMFLQKHHKSFFSQRYREPLVDEMKPEGKSSI